MRLPPSARHGRSLTIEPFSIMASPAAAALPALSVRAERSLEIG